jgi:hypothetical protein
MEKENWMDKVTKTWMRQDNIEVDFESIGYVDETWIRMTQDRVQVLVLVNAIMNNIKF